MNPASKHGMSTRRVLGGKKVPQGTKTKRVQIVLPAGIARAFGIVK